MKGLSSVVSDKKIFENCILKTFFWSRDLLMRQIRTIWTISVGVHTGTILVEFGQITISGLREEVVWTFPYIIQCDARTLNCVRKIEQRTFTLKLGSGGLWFLCIAFFLNEIYTPMKKCHVQICNSLWDIVPTSLWRSDGQRQIYMYISPPFAGDTKNVIVFFHSCFSFVSYNKNLL